MEMYMNRTKRNLILWAAIINLITAVLSLALTIIYKTSPALFTRLSEFSLLWYLAGTTYTEIHYAIIFFIIRFLASFFLLWSVRQRGKFFRVTKGLYLAGLIMAIIFGGTVVWILLFITMFIPDIIVMNDILQQKQSKHETDEYDWHDRFETTSEKKNDVVDDEEYESKKKQIADLKQNLKDGIITEEEYKEKLYELL